MNTAITAKLKDAWEAAGKALVEEPLIFINGKGNYWLNSHAKNFISKREVPIKDLMEWLRIGATHLQNLSYGDINFLMMHLPGDNVVAILREKAPNGDGKKDTLTSKEREILRYVVKGKSNKEIASYMKISSNTVNAHLDRIYMKLGCTSRVAASFLALKSGLYLPICERLAKKSRN